MLSFEEIGATGYREQQGYEIKARKRKELAKIYVKIAYTRMDRNQQTFENQAYRDGIEVKQNILHWFL